MNDRRISRPVRWLLSVWLAVVALGMSFLVVYSMTPGAQAESASYWPATSTLVRAPDRPTLVMVAHPHCSCTRASIAELSRLMTSLAGKLTGYVVFIKPDGMERDWERTDLWSSAARIDGIRVMGDPNGMEARRFGALTSGQVYLYAKDGQLRFQGGITPSRSHQGDSVGRQRILDLVTTGVTDRMLSAVFGCELEQRPNRSTSWWGSWAFGLTRD